jgi:hypothetical protein
MRPHVLAALPYPMQLLVGLIAYRKMSQTLYGQGTLRFTGKEIRSFRVQIWEDVNALLVAAKKNGNGVDGAPFWVLGGKSPSEADTTLFGFITAALVCSAYVLSVPQLQYVLGTDCF